MGDGRWWINNFFFFNFRFVYPHDLSSPITLSCVLSLRLTRTATTATIYANANQPDRRGRRLIPTHFCVDITLFPSNCVVRQ